MDSAWSGLGRRFDSWTALLANEAYHRPCLAECNQAGVLMHTGLAGPHLSSATATAEQCGRPLAKRGARARLAAAVGGRLHLNEAAWQLLA